VKQTIIHAENRLSFIPPQFNRGMLAFGRAIAPFYLRRLLGVRIERCEGLQQLADEYRRFSLGDSRLIIVFRHVHVNDAQVIFYLINNLLPKRMRRRGRPLGEPLPRRPHAHFLYGRGVPLWAGKGLEFVFSRLGGVPVSHRKLERESIDSIRSFISEGRFPVALAPEGQVTYHNRFVYEIEPGFAQLALWAAEDSGAAEVRVLPISQYYRYGDDPAAVLDTIFGAIEKSTGLRVEAKEPRARLKAYGSALLDRTETFYHRFYHLDFSFSMEGEFTRRRVEVLTDAVLALQERKFGVKAPYNGFTPRIFTVRQAGWDRIFHLDPAQRDERSKLDKAMDDFIASETFLFTRHLELVDLLSYLRPEYGIESDDPNRWIETALNLHDLSLRIQGGNISKRLDIKPTYVSFYIGKPISLSKTELSDPEISLRTRRNILVDEVSRQFEKFACQAKP
jgi:hypothetical protein